MQAQYRKRSVWAMIVGIGVVVASIGTLSTTPSVSAQAPQLSFTQTAIDSAATPPSNTAIQTVSCASADFCMALDNIGNIFMWNGISWTSQSDVYFSSGSTYDATSVSCTSINFCMATGLVIDSTTFLIQAEYAIMWNGSNWSQPYILNTEAQVDEPDAASSISCTSNDFCAVIQTGSIIGGSVGMANFWNGSLWSATQNIDPSQEAGSNIFTGQISCVNDDFCIDTLDFYPPGDVTGYDYFSTWNTGTWSLPAPVDDNAGEFPTSISCSSTTFCMETSFESDATPGLSTTQINLYNGVSWSVSPTPPTENTPTAISCPESSFCLATYFGSSGAPSFAVWDGTTWSDQQALIVCTNSTCPGDTPSDYQYNINATSCISENFCVAVGDDSVFMDNTIPSTPSLPILPTPTAKIPNRTTPSPTIAPGYTSPPSLAKTCNASSSRLPASPPQTVVVLANGIGSSIPGGSYNPFTVSECTSVNLNAPPSTVQAMIKNWQPDNNTIVEGSSSLTDTLANTGALLLPFSYNGATLGGSAAAPMFHFTGYNAKDVGDTLPTTGANLMKTEIKSIHSVWPTTHILVIGHSEGGLMAETWWQEYGYAQNIQVFSLDSPLNGLQDIESCFIGSSNLCSSMNLSPQLLNYWRKLWVESTANASLNVNVDQKYHNFTAIGTAQDPLYVFANQPASGQCSQFFWISDGATIECTSNQNRPAPRNQYNFSACNPGADVFLQLGLYNPISALALVLILSDHSAVKNCSSTIDQILLPPSN